MESTDRAGETAIGWEKLDQSTVESDLIQSNDILNFDLNAAGLPSRSWGFDWYVQVKPGDDYNTLLNLLGPTVPILDGGRSPRKQKGSIRSTSKPVSAHSS